MEFYVFTVHLFFREREEMEIVYMNQSNKIYPTVILFIIFFVCVYEYPCL